MLPERAGVPRFRDQPVIASAKRYHNDTLDTACARQIYNAIRKVYEFHRQLEHIENILTPTECACAQLEKQWGNVINLGIWKKIPKAHGILQCDFPSSGFVAYLHHLLND